MLVSVQFIDLYKQFMMTDTIYLVVTSSAMTNRIEYHHFRTYEDAEAYLRGIGASPLKLQENGRELWVRAVGDSYVSHELIQTSFR